MVTVVTTTMTTRMTMVTMVTNSHHCHWLWRWCQRRCWLVGSTLLPVPSFHHSLIRTNRANVLLNCNVLHSQHFAQLLQYVYSFHGLHSQLYQLRSTVVLYVGWGANKVFNTLSTDVLISFKRGSMHLSQCRTAADFSTCQCLLSALNLHFHISHSGTVLLYSRCWCRQQRGSSMAFPGSKPKSGWIGEGWGNARSWMHPRAVHRFTVHSAHCTYSQIHVRSARIQPPHPKLFWSKHSEMGVGCKFEEGTSVEWNSVKFNNHQKPASTSIRGKNRPKAAKLIQTKSR